MVEARRRLRIQRAENVDEGPPSRVSVPRQPAAKWTIDIRDGEHCDRLTLTLRRSPWPNQWLTNIGMLSTASVARRIREVIGNAA